MLSPIGTPKFSALVCHSQRRDPETGVRIFKYELTNDVTQYPLGRVICPESGKPGLDHPAVALISWMLPQLAKLGIEDRLEIVRKLIRLDSYNWQIGKNRPGDLRDEWLAARGQRLLQQSTADLFQNPNGSLKMVMDYNLDQRGGNLTALLQKQRFPSIPYTPFQYGTPIGQCAPGIQWPQLTPIPRIQYVV